MKLKSFTLIEMVVALALSAIVVGIVYLIYTIVGGQFKQQKEQNKLVYDHYLLHSLLTHDLDNSESIHMNSPGMIQLQMTDQRIAYAFDEGFITRQTALASDTFLISMHSVDVKKIDHQLISSLYLETTFMGESMRFFYKKNYAANTLMKLENEY